MVWYDRLEKAFRKKNVASGYGIGWFLNAQYEDDITFAF